MRRMVAMIVLVQMVGVALAQERIAPEAAQNYARILVQASAQTANQPLQVQPDADKPYGLKAGDEGALVIPAKSLTEEALQKAGKEVIPLAQLWVRNLTLVIKEQLVPNDKLSVVKVTLNEQEHSLPLFLLGVRKKEDGSWEMVIFAKDKEPLLAVPLVTRDGKQELPIELEARGENDRGILTLNILGKYQAQMTLAKQEQ